MIQHQAQHFEHSACQEVEQMAMEMSQVLNFAQTRSDRTLRLCRCLLRTRVVAAEKEAPLFYLVQG